METANPSESRSEVVPVASPDGVAEGEAATTTAAVSDQGARPDPNVTANGDKLDRQTRNWRALETDRDHWRDLALRYAQPQQATPPAATTPATDDKGKSLADFDYDEGRFQSYLFEQAESRAITAAEKRLRQQSEQEQAQRRSASFQTREAEFAKTVEDYHEVTRDPRVPISQAMAEVVAESDDGPALAYHLAKNLDVAARISQLSPLSAARELGRIEARLASERDKAKGKPLVSTAPPPPPKIDGSDPAIEVDPDKLSMKEWVKWDDKRMAKKAKQRG